MSDPCTENPPANEDPALLMAELWHADCGRLEEATSFARQRERARSDASDEELPEAAHIFLAAIRARDRLCDKLERLTRTVFKTKAQSFAGVAAKLSVALRDNAPSPDDPTERWVHLRTVQADLDRLVAALKAAAANDDQPGE
jgi:hypothetical protein